MKVKHFWEHIFLIVTAFVLLMPVVWVIFTSFTDPMQTRYIIKRTFSPEQFGYNVKDNVIDLQGKFEKGEGYTTTKRKFTFGEEHADRYVIVKAESVDNKETFTFTLMDKSFSKIPFNKIEKAPLYGEDEYVEEGVMTNLMPTANRYDWLCYFKTGKGGKIVSPVKVNTTAFYNFGNLMTLQNYKFIFWDQNFRSWLANSFIVSSLTAIISVLLGFFAGYSFSRFHFPGRKAGLLWVLATQLFPLAMMLIPLFVLATVFFPKYLGLSLTNNVFGLIFIYSATALPFAIWMLKGHFDSIPISLEEAASIDGASLWQMLTQILFPLSRSAMFTAFLFSFVQAWNEYAIADIFINIEEGKTLPLGLFTLLDPRAPKVAEFAAAAVIASIPVVVLFLMMRKELVSGATLGAVKG